VQRLTWSDGRAVRTDGARASVNGVHPFAADATYATGGRLERVRRDWLSDDAGDLAEGLERAATIVPERVIWDGRVSAPEPWPEDADALVEPLAAALDRAIRAAIADAPVEAPFVVQVVTSGEARTTFPPRVRVVGAAWRDRMRKRSKYDGAAIGELYKAVDAGHGVALDLVDRLDEAALRACRAFTTAFDATAIWTRDRRSDALADAVGDRLAALLNGAPVAGAADPFLALVQVGGQYSSSDGLERARRTAPHFDRFMASVASTRGKAARRTTVEQALRDRDALQAYLAEGGLPGHAARLAHEQAEVGFRLDAGDGRSRLGGRGLLPPGELWPADGDGHPLTFLAALDLSELPPSRLPGRGWMLFFADTGDGDMDTGFYGDAENHPGAEARLLFTEEPVDAGPPGELTERRVVATPFVMLPDGFGARELAGLDVFEGQTYDELANELARPTWNDAPHWVGGWATGCQGVVDDTGTLLLFHLSADDELGFSYLDAGTIQFRIPPGALAERDWSRVVAFAESS
jgi:hypothetical protein